VSLFDRFVAAIERLEPSDRRDGFVNLLNKVRLFRFDKAPHEFLPKSWSDEKRRFANEQLFLPFQFIALEDAASLVLIADEEKHQRGASKPRIVVDVVSATANLANFSCRDGKLKENEDVGDEQLTSSAAPKLFDFVMTAGRISTLEFRESGAAVQADGVVEVWTIKGTHMQPLPFVSKEIRDSFLINAVAGFEEVEFFNDPDFFIVEEVQEKERERYQKRARKLGRIARSHQRPVYTALRPKQIRGKLRLPAPSMVGGVRMPHERRAHLRTYRNDRFVNMKGRTIIVKACWIGPSGATVKGKRYRVLLDLLPPAAEQDQEPPP